MWHTPPPQYTIIPFRASALPFGTLNASCEAKLTSSNVIGMRVGSGCQTELRISTCRKQAQEHGPIPAHERRYVAHAKGIPELTGNPPLDRPPGGRLQPFWGQDRSLEYEGGFLPKRAMKAAQCPHRPFPRTLTQVVDHASALIRSCSEQAPQHVAIYPGQLGRELSGKKAKWIAHVARRPLGPRSYRGNPPTNAETKRMGTPG